MAIRDYLETLNYRDGDWRRAAVIFTLSSALGYGAMPLLYDATYGGGEDRGLLPMSLLREIALYAPGVFFGVGLLVMLRRPMLGLRPLFVVLVATIGWYAALRFAAAVYETLTLYGAGAIAGLIGGASVSAFIHLVDGGKFSLRRFAFLSALAAVLGLVSLPVGFLFVSPRYGSVGGGMEYIVLAYLIWQIGFGYAVSCRSNRPELSRFNRA